MKKKLSIEERIVESGLFYFDDGYLGSTGHGACYYDNNRENINKIRSENDLENIVLDKKFGEEDLFEVYDKENDDYVVVEWDKFFDKWFSDCDEYEIIDDGINGGNGYGKIIVDKVNKSIKIMVVPCLYSSYNNDKKSDIKIFGFDWESGELVREINNEELGKILEDKDYYIG
jgi:hypothetical protein